MIGRSPMAEAVKSSGLEDDMAAAEFAEPSATEVRVESSRTGVKRLPLGSTFLRRAFVPATVIVVWAFISSLNVVDPIFLPSPTDLYSAMIGMWPLLPSSFFSSVTMTLAGFLAGTAFGVFIGLLMAYSKNFRIMFGGILDFLRPVPVFALIPLFVLWFGLGRLPQISLIILGTSVILGLTTIEAVKNVPQVYVRAALVLGANRWTIYRSVIVPSITPHILGAIRVAAAASWGLDVAAEYIGAQTGLGHLMIVREQYLDTAGIIDVVIIYSCLALGLDFIIRIVERPLTRWTERSINRGIVASIVGSA
jgi:ABC-type nitrate/sulfonate/bicarbonate transport system permease component